MSRRLGTGGVSSALIAAGSRSKHSAVETVGTVRGGTPGPPFDRGLLPVDEAWFPARARLTVTQEPYQRIHLSGAGVDKRGDRPRF
jgi:hypothetical protein